MSQIDSFEKTPISGLLVHLAEIEAQCQTKLLELDSLLGLRATLLKVIGTQAMQDVQVEHKEPLILLLSDVA